MFQKIKFYFKPKTKKHFIFKLFTLQQIYFNTQKQNINKIPHLLN